MAGGRKKGTSKTGGRKKGSQNKTTVQVKEAILAAFEELGGVEYLVKVGVDDPKTFIALLSKLVPLEATVSGDITIELVSFKEE